MSVHHCPQCQSESIAVIEHQSNPLQIVEISCFSCGFNKSHSFWHKVTVEPKKLELVDTEAEDPGQTWGEEVTPSFGTYRWGGTAY